MLGVIGSDYMKPQKYKVRLNDKERTILQGIINQGTHTAKQIKRAEVLLELDQFYYFACEFRPQDIVASRCGVSTTTVYNISKQYVEEGLQAAINRKAREKPPVASIVTSEKAARIIALASSAPPEGHSRWTLRLLENKVTELGEVGRISDTTIGRHFKKNQINLRKTGQIQTE